MAEATIWKKSTVLNTDTTIGRADVVWVDDQRVLKRYPGFQSGQLVVSLIDNQGVAQPPVVVGPIADARGSRFPRMVFAGGESSWPGRMQVAINWPSAN